MINNKGEKIFEEIMKAKGFNLIYQPYIKKFKIRPDFYCLEDKTYYEVISTRQAFHNRKSKIKKAIKDGLNLMLVNPDGSLYDKKLTVPKHPLECKRCGFKWIPRKFEVRQCPKCKSAYWDTIKKVSRDGTV